MVSGTACGAGVDVCFCLTDGECFLVGQFQSIVIWPWNGKSYFFPPASPFTYSGDKGTTIVGAFFYEDGFTPVSVTENNLIIKSVACGACPAASTCNA